MLKKNELMETMIEEVATYSAEDIIDLDMKVSWKYRYLEDNYKAYGLSRFISLKDFILKVDKKINNMWY